MPVPAPKRRHSSGRAPASDWGAIVNYYDGVWVDLDQRKRPKTALKLFGWATPEGWRQGLCPQVVAGTQSEDTAYASVESGSSNGQRVVESDIAELVCQIEALGKPLGKAPAAV